MPYHLKHYFALTLGAGVAFVFGMQFHSGHSGSGEFIPTTHDLKSLDTFDRIVSSTPSPAIVDVEAVASWEPPVTVYRDQTESRPMALDSEQWYPQETPGESRVALGNAERVVGQTHPRELATDRSADEFGPSYGDPGTVHFANDSTGSGVHQVGELAYTPVPGSGSSKIQYTESVSDSELVSGSEMIFETEFAGAANESGNAEAPILENASDRDLFTVPTVVDQLASGHQQMTESVVPMELPLAESAAIQAVHHIEYGKSLSRRGSTFAARQEFLSALQVIADANDVQSGDVRYTQSLKRAILTLKEAEDFSIRDVENQISMDVASVVGSHRSGVLNAEDVNSMTLNQAMRRYFSEAQHHLDVAGGRNVVAAEAFYCLGKLHTTSQQSQTAKSDLEMEKAIVFHQAAILSAPGDSRSSNELGVLMARSGRLQEAKKLFRQSLVINQSPQTWSNLAAAHRRLGEDQRAQQAELEVARSSQSQITGSDASIQWLPAGDFNSAGPTGIQDRMASQVMPTQGATTQGASTQGASSRGQGQWRSSNAGGQPDGAGRTVRF